MVSPKLKQHLAGGVSTYGSNLNRLRAFNFDAWSPAGQNADLAAASARCLAEGDYYYSFCLADRSCRTQAVPEPEPYLLRAEASYRLGFSSYAIDDAETALRLSPLHCLANRKLLAWTAGERRLAAALALLAAGCGGEPLQQAIAVLLAEGAHGVGTAINDHRGISGWALWRGEDQLQVKLQWETGRYQLVRSADPSHPQAAWTGKACSFQIPLEELKGSSLSVELSSGDRAFFETTLYVPGRQTLPPAADLRQRIGPPADVAIIVPVYGDLEATQRCLASLHRRSGAERSYRIVIVDDASPDPELKRYVRDWVRSERGASLIENHLNLGYAGAVNRALETLADCDVILLNADTVVPPGALARLRRTAYRSNDIGTAIPLSNHGWLTSFPLPYRENPLPDDDTIAALDRSCEQANKDLAVDLPTGIGFCLLIKAECLRRVGLMSTVLGRGYFEDVDFCLRAKDAGFRNVCAASVFVGHAGSRSFGEERRTLVARNFARIKAIYPDYDQDMACFVAADPLQQARHRLARRVPWGSRSKQLVMVGDGLLADVARRRAEQSAKSPLLVIGSDGGAALEIEGAVVARFEPAELAGFLEQERFQRLEIIGTGQLAPNLAEWLLEQASPLDFTLAGGQSFVPPMLRRRFTAAGHLSAESADRVLWLKIAERAETIWAMDARALGFAKVAMPEFVADRAVLLPDPDSISVAGSQPPDFGPARRVGVFPAAPSAEEHSLLISISRAFQRRGAALEFVVFGETINDLALMACPNSFVSGAFAGSEFERLLRQYQIHRLLFPVRQPLFGQSTFAQGLASGLPIAYFDWSFGKTEFGEQNLLLDPSASADTVIKALAKWLQ